MDAHTRAQLRAVNRRFYDGSASAFAASRDHAWPGWSRIPLPPGRPLRALDVGCGNARFAAALRERLGVGFSYVGIDESRAMLAHADETLSALQDVERSLCAGDVLDAGSLERAAGGRFDLVAAFGLLHHVPGAQERRAFLAELAECVAEGGVLAVTAWQFADRDRFAGRIVPWSTLASHGLPPVDPGQLEPGDHLLSFGGESGALRYCHHSDEAELDALVAALPLEEIDRFSADGRSGDLNRYLVLRRPATGGAP